MLLASALLAAAPVRAAGQMQVPEKFENLKVLPADIPRDTLVQVMRGISMSLGVRCQYCHVPAEPGAAAAGGGGMERLHFASDEKPAKNTARFMMRMTDSLNRVVLAALPDRRDPPVRVECVTCHRGSPVPRTLAAVLTEAIDRFGVDSAVARYKALRQDMASGRYDFSEQSVNELARRLDERGKTAEAVAMLQMNQEFYPASPQIDFLLAEVYIRRGERDKAIERYRAVLARQPNNQQARRRLDELLGRPRG